LVSDWTDYLTWGRADICGRALDSVAVMVVGPNKERLRQVLSLVLAKKAMPKSRLHKLLYLLEREAVIRTGKPAIGLRFQHQQFGMFSPGLADQLDDLHAEGFLASKEVRADTGVGQKFSLNQAVGLEIPAELRDLCNLIDKTYGGLSLTVLISRAKSTAPFTYTKRGEWIDWELLAEERCGSTDRLTAEMEGELVAAKARIARGQGTTLGKDYAIARLRRSSG
jgi:hypothetical protein